MYKFVVSKETVLYALNEDVPAEGAIDFEPGAKEHNTSSTVPLALKIRTAHHVCLCTLSRCRI